MRKKVGTMLLFGSWSGAGLIAVATHSLPSYGNILVGVALSLFVFGPLVGVWLRDEILEFSDRM